MGILALNLAWYEPGYFYCPAIPGELRIFFNQLEQVFIVTGAGWF